MNSKMNNTKKINFDTFMLKEIFEQPETIKSSLAGRIVLNGVQVEFDELKKIERKLKSVKQIIILGSGSSWHAGLLGELLIEQLAKISVEVKYSSEFRASKSIIGDDSLVIAISQSGETADTLAALKLAKQKGALTLSICNVIGSRIAKLTDATCNLKAGPEIALAATKTFTSELSLLVLLAVYLGSLNKKLKVVEVKKISEEMLKLSSLVRNLLTKNDEIFLLAKKFKAAENFIYLGQNYNFPIALEGALKLKETSYIHAEGYPMAEIKHGPLALVDKKMPVVFVATQDEAYNKIIDNILAVKSAGGRIIALASKGDKKISRLAEHVIYLPKAPDILMPILNVIPLQLLAYHLAGLKGRNVDKPRHLVKSVRE
jgi:glucosamine--fructose-6-phosphate aminotransferase (isomerizing)